MLLSTDLWVSALLQRVQKAGSFAYVARKGDQRAGSVLIKVVNLRTRDAYILREAQTGLGQSGDDNVWIRPVKSTDEMELGAYIDRQVRYDADLWVIEIEDADGRAFLTEKVDLS